MTDIWDEKPKHDISSQVEHYCFIYYKDEVDAWLEKLRGQYLNLTDYKRWWMELRELLREYFVDCNDADIIFSQIKDWKKNAEKWNWLTRKDSLLSYDFDKIVKADETPVLLSDKAYRDFVDRARKLGAVKDWYEAQIGRYFASQWNLPDLQKILWSSEFTTNHDKEVE